MAHGKIVEQGSHEELLGREGHYALLVAMDLQNDRITTISEAAK
jgi:ABC-type multidrug transport system fused ATPase/permease subunit